MSHPYDASTKYLVQTRLADWLPLCGRVTTAPVEIVNADLSTVTAAADRVLRVREDPAWLFHLELQSSRDPRLVTNLHVYNALLERQFESLVRTVVVLLRSSADAPDLTGLLRREFPGEQPYLIFHYQVVRVWEAPVATFLNGGLGILPLAPLSAVEEGDLQDVVARMEERIRAEATPEVAAELWTATGVLMGLRYPRELINQLLERVHGMKDSVTYQAIVEEGKIVARREDLLRLGQRRFGPPTNETKTTLLAIDDLDRLGALVDKLLDASSWEELLSAP